MGPSLGGWPSSVQWALPSNDRTKIEWDAPVTRKKISTKNKSPNTDIQRLKRGTTVGRFFKRGTVMYYFVSGIPSMHLLNIFCGPLS